MVMDNIYQKIITNCKQISKSDFPHHLEYNILILMVVFELFFCYIDKLSEAVNLKGSNIYWDSKLASRVQFSSVRGLHSQSLTFPKDISILHNCARCQ